MKLNIKKLVGFQWSTTDYIGSILPEDGEKEQEK